MNFLVMQGSLAERYPAAQCLPSGSVHWRIERIFYQNHDHHSVTEVTASTAHTIECGVSRASRSTCFCHKL
ncbi:hypothetical protein [Burkholderia stabilis]|uniref:hypothetical protein n=1 Tax=Burkholderia stabilis TaxID=95485 RepID=UPI001F4B2F49|nr:hypothetical protein [Burkholderia stabilis]